MRKGLLLKKLYNYTIKYINTVSKPRDFLYLELFKNGVETHLEGSTGQSEDEQ